MAKSAVLFWPIYGFLDTLYVDISSYYDFISCMWCISMFLLFWTWPLIELWGHRRPLNISVAWKRRSTDRYIKYIIYYIYNIYILLYILYYSVLIFVFCFLNMLFWGLGKPVLVRLTQRNFDMSPYWDRLPIFFASPKRARTDFNFFQTSFIVLNHPIGHVLSYR